MSSSQVPFPNPNASWANDNYDTPGFVAPGAGFAVHGVDNTPGNKAYFIHLEAKPGKEDLVQKFLQDINNGVNQEPGTRVWFGTRYSQTTFLIFEAFPDNDRRNDHSAGPGGQNFVRFELLKDMLVTPAQIYRLDVLHGKFGNLLGDSKPSVVKI